MSPRKRERVLRQAYLFDPYEGELDDLGPPRLLALVPAPCDRGNEYHQTRLHVETGELVPPPPEPPVRPPRKHYFATPEQEQRAGELGSLVRGVMISALDDSYESGALAEVLFRRPEDLPPELERMVELLAKARGRQEVLAVLEDWGRNILGLVQLALFPQEFEDDPETLLAIKSFSEKKAAERAAKARDGILPSDGGERVGAERFIAFAEGIVGARASSAPAR